MKGTIFSALAKIKKQRMDVFPLKLKYENNHLLRTIKDEESTNEYDQNYKTRHAQSGVQKIKVVHVSFKFHAQHPSYLRISYS